MINTMSLNKLDARIVAELQADGRLPVVDLGERIGLTSTPCARRVRQLEERGVIVGYTAIVDPARLGLNVQAFIQVKLDRHTDENVEVFERELAAIEQIVSCHATTGEYDFMLRVAAVDLDALSTLVLKQLLRIPGVRDVYSSIVLDTVKRPTRLPVGHLT